MCFSQFQGHNNYILSKKILKLESKVKKKKTNKPTLEQHC